jgi:dinuclear metal center YbgI/SA1388 family protein
MAKIKEVVQYLENIAPPAYQESYDNSGLLTGDQNLEVSAILISLDCTEEIVEEAIKKKCNLIIAHHPIIFKGLKSITGKNYIERTIIKAIKHDISIYSIHTNLDNIHTGVNKKICDIIGLKNTKILQPKKNILEKLVVFVPSENTDAVTKALNDAGAGTIGKYKNCSFRTKGTGTFEPTEDADPYIGEQSKLEQVEENRIEVIFPAYLQKKILQAMWQAHPYEEVAYYLQSLENENQEVGSGMIGELDKEMDEKKFLLFLKEKMNLNIIKHTPLLNKEIKKVAVCGGAGSFLLPSAIRQGADIFITADFKYHEYFDADRNLIIADIGHYESEIYTKDLVCELLSKKFTNIATNLSEKVTNPISYL